MRRLYTMLELVVALGLLAVLSACFLASLKTLREADRFFVAESRATLVLDNTLERAVSCGTLDAKKLQRIFELEYGKSPFAAEPRYGKTFEFGKGKALLRILNEKGRPLAEVTLKCKE